MKRLFFAFCALSLLVAVIPADAWVAAGGAYHGAAVGPRGAAVWGPRGGAVVARPYGTCCYSSGPSGWAVAGAVATGVVIGSTIAKAQQPTTVVVNPTIVVAPAVGTVVYTLPTACSGIVISGVSYYQCSSAYYRPMYQGGVLVYQVVVP